MWKRIMGKSQHSSHPQLSMFGKVHSRFKAAMSGGHMQMLLKNEREKK